MATEVSRASQALAKAFSDNRGAQARLAERTGISAGRLSHLANGGQPSLKTSLKLKGDPEIPIDLAWWTMPPLRERRAAAKGAA